MIKKVFFLLAMFTCIFASCSDGGSEEPVTPPVAKPEENKPTVGSYKNGVVTIATAGTLKKLLGDDYLNITSLKIVGPINGNDVLCLRQMHWGDGQGGGARLATLDLSDATIVEGGESYYSHPTENSHVDVYTSDNVIGDYMFCGSKNLQDVKLPENITSIGRGAFSFSEALTNIIIHDNVTSIGQSAFEGCNALTDVSIGNGVTSIGRAAFSQCHALTNVSIGSGVTSIDEKAFNCCDALISFIIPDNVTSIGKFAFQGCDVLTNISIGSGVTSIERGAFDACSITKCYCYAITPPVIEYDTFKGPNFVYDLYYFGVKKNAILYVPAGSGCAYEASVWSSIFDMIEEME